jgi:hypothetical protein
LLGTYQALALWMIWVVTKMILSISEAVLYEFPLFVCNIIKEITTISIGHVMLIGIIIISIIISLDSFVLLEHAMELPVGCCCSD